MPNPDQSDADVPYRRLWLNVILRAVEDARGQDLMCEEAKNAPGIRGDAKRWLSRPSRDLELVCEWSGAEYEKLLERYGGKYGMRGKR